MSLSIQVLYGGAKGGIMDQELALLYRLAIQLPRNSTVVEIGSFQGKSTLVLAHALKKGRQGTVFAVDPHCHPAGPNNAEILRQNIAKSGLDNIRMITDYSYNFIKSFSNPINLLWLDGDHGEDGVFRDFADFQPLVVTGGKVALHDAAAFPGPRKIAHRKLFRSPAFV
ncbi:MAG: class I SAM-dependent methyltransferase [Kiritimatiellia bacterium]